MSTRPSTGLALAFLLGMCISAWSAGGFTEEKLQDSGLIDPSQIPSVHNTLYQVPEGAVSWDVLDKLDVRTEVLGPLRATFHTEYSAEIVALDGQDVPQQQREERDDRHAAGVPETPAHADAPGAPAPFHGIRRDRRQMVGAGEDVKKAGHQTGERDSHGGSAFSGTGCRPRSALMLQ